MKAQQQTTKTENITLVGIKRKKILKNLRLIAPWLPPTFYEVEKTFTRQFKGEDVLKNKELLATYEGDIDAINPNEVYEQPYRVERPVNHYLRMKKLLNKDRGVYLVQEYIHEAQGFGEQMKNGIKLTTDYIDAITKVEIVRRFYT